MIYFLHGSDTYRSRKRLREIIVAYQKKWGGVLGFTRLDAEEDDLGEKLPPHSVTLFRQKTLLVIENACAAKKDYTKLLEVRCPVWKDDSEAFVILWEREISAKRKKSAEFLKTYAAKTQEFPAPDSVALRRLVLEEAKERGIALGRDAVEALVLVGGDSWAVVRELEKYEVTNAHESATNYTNDNGRIREIRGSFADIRAAAGQLKPYHLIDAVIEGRRDALRLFHVLRETAAIEDIMLLGSFVNAVRWMLFLKSAKNAAEQSRIAKEEGMHPFVAKKLAAQSWHFSLDELKKIYQRLLAADILAKTGAHPVHSIIQRIVETGLRFDLYLS